MDATSLVGSASVVLSLVTFLGIVAWAYSRKRKQAFADAANAPFALPDDAVGTPPPARAEGDRA